MSRTICWDGCRPEEIIFIIYGILVAILANYSYLQFVRVMWQEHMLSRSITVLNSRLAIIIPIYSVLFMGILCVPARWLFFETVISFVEGYCIYCFYRMLTFVIGSREQSVKCIESSDYTKPCCYSCQKKTPSCCYSFVDMALVQFFTLRPFLFLVVAILEEHDYHGQLNKILEIGTVISLVVAMVCLLRVYHFLAPHCQSIAPAKKVLFIKAIILLLVIENIIVESQQKNGMFEEPGENMEEDNVHKYDRFRQYFAVVGSTQTLIFTLLMNWTFGLREAKDVDATASLAACEDGEARSLSKIEEKESYISFYLMVLKFWRIIFDLPLTTTIGRSTELGHL